MEVQDLVMQNYPDKYCKFVDDSKFTQFLEDIRMVFISNIIKYHKPKSILDVGCGMRPVRWFCDLDGCVRYDCVEPNPSKELDVPTLYDCKLEDIKPIQHGIYDMIILSSLVHIVDDIDIFLVKVKEFCHEDTIIYINTPNSLSLHRIIGFHSGMLDNLNNLSDKDIEFGHKRTFNIKTLKEKVGEYFIILNSGSYLLKPFSDKQMNTVIEPNERVLFGLTKTAEMFPNLGCEVWVEAKA